MSHIGNDCNFLNMFSSKTQAVFVFFFILRHPLCMFEWRLCREDGWMDRQKDRKIERQIDGQDFTGALKVQSLINVEKKHQFQLGIVIDTLILTSPMTSQERPWSKPKDPLLTDLMSMLAVRSSWKDNSQGSTSKIQALQRSGQEEMTPEKRHIECTKSHFKGCKEENSDL